MFIKQDIHDMHIKKDISDMFIKQVQLFQNDPPCKSVMNPFKNKKVLKQQRSRAGKLCSNQPTSYKYNRTSIMYIRFVDKIEI